MSTTAELETREALEEQHAFLLALIMRQGQWLVSERGQMLPLDAWETRFVEYQRNLDKLRSLGERLYPLRDRNRYEPLAGDALTSEICELFAA